MQRHGTRSDAEQVAERRRRMVHDQMLSRGIHDARVLAAMAEVPRERFVPAGLQREAYDDCPLPIGFGQTISQPFTVAFMLEALALEGWETVLEIGTGSGYAAAALSHLARRVHTVERIPELAHLATCRLDELGYANVHVHLADGTCGLPNHAPFDAIAVTAAAADLPGPYRDQLAEGGRIVIPIGEPMRQTLVRFTRNGQQLSRTDLGAFAFVPLIGEHGWHVEKDADDGPSA